MAARPNVTLKELSIPAATLINATGRMAFAIVSERGRIDDFMYISNTLDLENTVGVPTSLATSVDFHLCKAFLAYGNDIVLYRAIDSDTAEMSRIGFDFSLTGYTDSLNEAADEKLFTDSTLHTLKSGMDLEFYAREPYVLGNDLSVAICKWDSTDTATPTWQDVTDVITETTTFPDEFEYGPSPTKSEIAVAVLNDGVIVEKFIVSLDETNKNDAGELNWVDEYIASKSAYIYAFGGSSVYDSVVSVESTSLANGTAGTTASSDDIQTAYSKFIPKNDITFDYIMGGQHTTNRSYILDNICEVRKDCIGFFSPNRSDIIGISDTDTIVDNIVIDRQTFTNSVWATYSGNWKLTRDIYRGKDIWIPIDGDIIGNKVRVNTEREVWIPAAGNTNGRMKNVIKLAFNPTEGQQNTLYKNGINHVVFKAGKGYIVDGQKTMTDKNIGVSRTHNRDVLRVMEQYVLSFADDFLHEFNNATTRARFRSLIEPFLEDILNRGGLVDFKVICDETNNTPAVIDALGFRCDVLVKLPRAIEQITITFFDTPISMDFSEVTA